MKTIAVIPLRTGSQGLPDKHTKSMQGKPLFLWTVDQAKSSECFDQIVIATNDAAVWGMADHTAQIELVTISSRHMFTDGPKAATEAVLLEVILDENADRVCLLQATSPLRRPEDIREAIHLLDSNKAVASFVQDHHIWDDEPRQMRQDMAKLRENGAIYAFNTEAFLTTLDRRCGGATPLIMPSWTGYEIDDEDDWDIVKLMIEKHILGRHKSADAQSARHVVPG